MSETEVRIAGPDDLEALSAMVEAMDRHYGDWPRPAGRTEAAAARWLHSRGSDARFALAFAEEEPVGLAVFAVLHPGNDLTGLLFLKDLFVLDEWRSRGVGGALMRFLGSYCVERGIGRIDWQVEDDKAQAFYERLGARVMPEKRFMRIDSEALAKLGHKD